MGDNLLTLMPRKMKLPNLKPRKSIPYPFVLEELAPLEPRTKAMFGCHAVYIKERIIFILRERENSPKDNGVWIATHEDHHASLLKEFPNMRSIEIFRTKETHWQVLPADAPDFESAAMRACELVLARDPRIGKIPKSRR